jgi:hypothetical protein
MWPRLISERSEFQVMSPQQRSSGCVWLGIEGFFARVRGSDGRLLNVRFLDCPLLVILSKPRESSSSAFPDCRAAVKDWFKRTDPTAPRPGSPGERRLMAERPERAQAPIRVSCSAGERHSTRDCSHGVH